MSGSPRKWRLKLLIAIAITIASLAVFEIFDDSTGFKIVRHFSAFDQPPNYSRIEDGLWMGGHVDRPPPGTGAVLNLCESKDPYEVESNRVDAIPDAAPAPSIEWLARQVAYIESQRAAGRTVYVHCYGGVSRSGMVMAAYFMRREGWSADQAIQFLQSKRRVVNPNAAFRSLLGEWERFLKPPKSAASTTQP